MSVAHRLTPHVLGNFLQGRRQLGRSESIQHTTSLRPIPFRSRLACAACGVCLARIIRNTRSCFPENRRTQSSFHPTTHAYAPRTASNLSPSRPDAVRRPPHCFEIHRKKGSLSAYSVARQRLGSCSNSRRILGQNAGRTVLPFELPSIRKRKPTALLRHGPIRFPKTTRHQLFRR